MTRDAAMGKAEARACRGHVDGAPSTAPLCGRTPPPGLASHGQVAFRRPARHQRFDRTPLYAELARLETGFQQALGVYRRFKHTIADMLLKEEELTILQLEQEISKRLTIVPAKDLHIEKYEIIWQR